LVRGIVPTMWLRSSVVARMSGSLLTPKISYERFNRRLTCMDALASRQALSRNPSEDLALVSCSATLGGLAPRKQNALDHRAAGKRAERVRIPAPAEP